MRTADSLEVSPHISPTFDTIQMIQLPPGSFRSSWWNCPTCTLITKGILVTAKLLRQLFPQHPQHLLTTIDLIQFFLYRPQIFHLPLILHLAYHFTVSHWNFHNFPGCTTISQAVRKRTELSKYVPFAEHPCSFIQFENYNGWLDGW